MHGLTWRSVLDSGGETPMSGIIRSDGRLRFGDTISSQVLYQERVMCHSTREGLTRKGLQHGSGSWSNLGSLRPAPQLEPFSAPTPCSGEEGTAVSHCRSDNLGSHAENV